jgi:hypothetical protein
VAPVPLRERERWTVLPLPAETVLCGNDLTLPLLEPLQALFTGLEDMEGVFYGWPTVVIENDRRQPFVAPLFVRGLDKPSLSVDGNEPAFVAVGEPLPQVNMGLLTTEWFSPELVASAAAVLAEGLIGFGQPQAMMAVAHQLVTILGLPGDPLDPVALTDPTTFVDPWRPQEVGVFNLVMAFKGELDVATRSLIKDLQWMTGVPDWRASAARFLFETAPAPAPSLPTSCALELNDSQERALASASNAPLTVITGPPGTGKSQTVAAIVADAWLRGETALVTSTNNTPGALARLPGQTPGHRGRPTATPTRRHRQPTSATHPGCPGRHHTRRARDCQPHLWPGFRLHRLRCPARPRPLSP